VHLRGHDEAGTCSADAAKLQCRCIAATAHAQCMRKGCVLHILATRGTLQPKVALYKVVAPAPHRVRAVEEDDDPLVVHLRIAR
jgi:hypothetical protein